MLTYPKGGAYFVETSAASPQRSNALLGTWKVLYWGVACSSVRAPPIDNDPSIICQAPDWGRAETRRGAYNADSPSRQGTRVTTTARSTLLLPPPAQLHGRWAGRADLSRARETVSLIVRGSAHLVMSLALARLSGYRRSRQAMRLASAPVSRVDVTFPFVALRCATSGAG
jgi:hypothetical protein